jgi:hypothetical protein
MQSDFSSVGDCGLYGWLGGSFYGVLLLVLVFNGRGVYASKHSPCHVDIDLELELAG